MADMVQVGRVRRHRPGALVLLRAGVLPVPLPGVAPETEIVCLNAQRRGKGFLNHYLVPLDPPVGSRDALSLIYVDDTVPLTTLSESHRLTLIPVAAPQARVGQILETPAGRYLKTTESYKDAISLAYVDLDDGAVLRRRERDVRAVYDWRIDRCAASDHAATMPDPTETGAHPVTVRPLASGDVAAAAALLDAQGLGEAAALAQRLARVAGASLSISQIAHRGDATVGVVLAVHDGWRAWISTLATASGEPKQAQGKAPDPAIAAALIAAVEADAARRDVRILPAPGDGSPRSPGGPLCGSV